MTDLKEAIERLSILAEAEVEHLNYVWPRLKVAVIRADLCAVLAALPLPETEGKI